MPLPMSRPEHQPSASGAPSSHAPFQAAKSRRRRQLSLDGPDRDVFPSSTLHAPPGRPPGRGCTIPPLQALCLSHTAPHACSTIFLPAHGSRLPRSQHFPVSSPRTVRSPVLFCFSLALTGFPRLSLLFTSRWLCRLVLPPAPPQPHPRFRLVSTTSAHLSQPSLSFSTPFPLASRS